MRQSPARRSFICASTLAHTPRPLSGWLLLLAGRLGRPVNKAGGAFNESKRASQRGSGVAAKRKALHISAADVQRFSLRRRW